MIDDLLDQIGKGGLIQGTLSSPSDKKGEGAIVKVDIRPVMLKGRLIYQASEYVDNKVYHKNLSPEECLEYVQSRIGSFRQGIFSTKETYFHITVDKDGGMKVKRKAIAEEMVLQEHNKKKNYLLQEGVPIPFLVALGVMSPEGIVHAKRYDKFKQINRFCEVVGDVLEALPKGRQLNIIDFGCGKSYLTFALHHFLHHVAGWEAKILGLDLKKEVIEDCAALAKELKLEDLTFAVADINTFEQADKVDMVISLHACDTATDAALEKAVKWGADVILCVPCCQHELYRQVKCDQLESLLRYGILKERFAALATDAARAEFLEMLGYETQLMEFIDLEHTPKNLMLRAMRGHSLTRREKAAERYAKMKELLKILPSIERRFPEAPYTES